MRYHGAGGRKGNENICEQKTYMSPAVVLLLLRHTHPRSICPVNFVRSSSITGGG